MGQEERFGAPLPTTSKRASVPRRGASGAFEYLVGGGERYKSRYRAVEVLSCICFFYVLWLTSADIVVGLVSRAGLLLLVPPIALIAYLSADFASGVVHWAADTYGTRETPFIGPKFVAPFRDHHTDPLGITRHDFVEANGDNCLLALLVLVPAHIVLPTAHTAWATTLMLYLALFCCSGVLTSMIHGWAHRSDPPRIVRWLQGVGLVLAADHHELHHCAPHRSHYCITTGWLNPLLDRTRFFQRVERVLARLNIHPGTDTEVSR